ncbi:MAG TPA: sialidase family protein, partial [Candidatus Thermoplasmatota archaeon]|nr:sialidase family protein [Candidatus Thermoplasmatota archaeon]
MAGFRSSAPLLVTLLLITSPILAGCLTPAAAPTTTGPSDRAAPPEGAPTGGIAHLAVPAGATPTGEALLGADASGQGSNASGVVGASRYTGSRSFEPTLGVDAEGRVFFGSYKPGLPYFGLLRRSDDQGKTWKDVTPNLAGVVSLPPNSNDPYVHVDPDTDRIFLSDLQALQCSTLSFSDDAGATWTHNPVGCGHPVTAPIHDHQTVFTARPRTVTPVGYPNVVYYCVNRQVETACATSLNGGLSFGPLRPLVIEGITNAGETGVICIGGHTAHGTSGPDGTAYLPTGQCESFPIVAITKDDGLTWTVVRITKDVRVYGHEVAFAVDEAGNAYAFWIGKDDHLPYLAVSKDGGYTWGKPLMVAPPGVGTADFPTIAAGADGRIAFAYYGTAAAKPYADMGPEDTWNTYIGITTDALAATPTIITVTANDPADPVARGVCGGTRCNNAVGDFIDIVIDGEGRPWAAFVDACVAACVTGAALNDGNAGFAGTLAAMVGKSAVPT